MANVSWPHRFSAEKMDSVLRDLERLRPRGRAVAAFDADGTLWDTDLGESLFKHQIDNALVPLPKDPWEHYHRMKDTISHPAAYLWLAQINEGVPLETVRQWAEAAVQKMDPLPVFPEQRLIFDKLRALDVEIYIVTASITWAVEPGARRLSLSADRVIGIETWVRDGLVTREQKGVITYREGKTEALLERTRGLKPYFCAGNSEGDRWLLEGATHLRLVMSAAETTHENWETEQKMLSLAQQRGWLWHRYR
jgi:phosphoserine phosphatase